MTQSLCIPITMDFESGAKQILTYMFHLHIKPIRFNDFVYFGALIERMPSFSKEFDHSVKNLII